MTESNVEAARRGFQSNRSGPADETVEVALSLADPELEFTSRLSAVEGTLYRGHEGLRRYFDDMADAWREWHNEVHSIAEAAADALVIEFTFHAVGKESGAGIELEQSAVLELRNGRIRRLQIAPTSAEALRAAGLAE